MGRVRDCAASVNACGCLAGLLLKGLQLNDNRDTHASASRVLASFCVLYLNGSGEPEEECLRAALREP